MSEPVLKQCRRCGEKKNIAYFHKKHSVADGHSTICIHCEKAYQLKYKAVYLLNPANRERIRKRNRISRVLNYHLHPEKQKAASKKYYEKNQQACDIARKKWNEANPDRIRDLKKNSDSYFRSLVVSGTSLKPEEIPPSLVKLKKKLINYKRLCKQKKQQISTN